jgi:5-hydroxyisourate hydrolase-like protein (transthyretin family)
MSRTLLVFGVLAGKALGCVCGVSPAANPACQYAWQYDAVFAGMVTDIADPAPPVVSGDQTARRLPGLAPLAFPQRKVQIRIIEALAGLAPDQKDIVVETGLGGGDCGYGFRRGRDYIVYAQKKREGGFSTDICSPTRPLEDAAADLKYFHQLGEAPETSEIRVTAYDVHGKWRSTPGATPEPPALAGVRVNLDGNGVHQSATTDAAGRHVFSGLPAGEYTVQASLEGYTAWHAAPPVRVHSKGCAEVAAPLQLDRVVSGRIFSKDGRPAPGVTVEAVPMRPRYENDLPLAADSATTNEDGRYELRRLTTGDYYLGVSLSGSPTLQSPYTRWFYPGTEDPGAAGMVHISDRPEALQLNLTLPNPPRARVISGKVLWPDGRPAAGVAIFLEDPRWPWRLFSVVATGTDRDGRFTIAGALSGTRYRVHADRLSGSDWVSAEPVTIEPGSDPLDIKLVLTRKGRSVAEATDKGLEDWRRGLGLR